MIPPPITSRRRASPSTSSAEVESRMRGSSGRFGQRGVARARREDRGVERDPARAGRASPPRRSCGEASRAAPVTTSTLRCFASWREPAGEPLHDRVLVRAQLGEVERRRAERHAVLGERRRLADRERHVQQRLRRDAADVQADAAERRVALDEHDALAEICGAKRRGVAARARRRARAPRRRAPCAAHGASA